MFHYVLVDVSSCRESYCREKAIAGQQPARLKVAGYRPAYNYVPLPKTKHTSLPVCSSYSLFHTARESKNYLFFSLCFV